MNVVREILADYLKIASTRKEVFDVKRKSARLKDSTSMRQH